MSVLIVIPCLNEEAHIEILMRQMVGVVFPCPFQIVIADGGSTDRTKPIAEKLALEFPQVVYLFNPGRLQSAAINLAVAQYGNAAEFLIRLDAHADYPDTYCATLIAEAQETGAASIVVAMETVATGGFQKGVAAAQNSKLGNGGSAHRSLPETGRFVDHGHHALMRIDAFTAVGGYDEGFSHNEDAEMDTRLAQAGYKLWLTAKTYMYYYPRADPVALFRQYMKYGRGRAATILKHRTRPKPRQLAPAAVLPAALLALLGGVFALPLLAWAGLCIGYGMYLGIKAEDPVVGFAGPAAMIMHLAWSIGFWRGMILR